MTKSRLQEEIKKKRSFESPEHEAILNMVRTNDRFQNRLGRLFREYELTASQYNVLRILRSEGKPMPSLEIGQRMVQAVPAITGLLDRLEKQGLISRQRSADDRRVVFVELTEGARNLIKKLDKPVLEMHEQLIGHLSRAELKELNRLLDKARLSLNDTDG
jgi:MarR family transcriptional regulator, 2-MHQ and catechol-resistance regulon repressor